MADTAVKQLLDTINDLKRRVEILERRSDETARTPHFWREDTMASAVARHNTDIRNQYITTGATVADAIVLDYSAIRNAPNAITHIQSASDALIVDYADGQRQFIPLHISRQGMM